MNAPQTIGRENEITANPQKIAITIIYDDKPSVVFTSESISANEADALAEASQKHPLTGVKMILISKLESEHQNQNTQH